MNVTVKRDRCWRLPAGSSVWIATILLFVVSGIIQPRSLAAISIGAMLPVAAVLAIAAIGQTLVIQQRGVDLSVGGVITLAAFMIGKLHQPLPLAIVLVLLLSAFIGLVNGIVVNVLRVTPLIATLAMSSILAGAVLAYSNATPSSAPESLSAILDAKVLGVPGIAWVALVFVIVAAVVMSWTSAGRRFVAIGASVAAARAAGLRPTLYGVIGYLLAGACYGAAGIALAGYVTTPPIDAGATYTLPSVAAVVVGGTALTGGRGRLIGSAVGAVLLSQLDQFILSIGAPTSIQMIVQAAVIAVAAAVQLDGRQALVRIRRILGIGQRSRRSAPAGPVAPG